MNANDLLMALPEQTFETAEIDVSRFWSKPEGCVVLRFRDPDLGMIGQASLDAPRYRKYNHEWPASLTESMALMGCALVDVQYRESPDAQPTTLTIDNRGEYIATLANRSNDAFAFAMGNFFLAFPHLTVTPDIVSAEKNA